MGVYNKDITQDIERAQNKVFPKEKKYNKTEKVKKEEAQDNRPVRQRSSSEVSYPFLDDLDSLNDDDEVLPGDAEYNIDPDVDKSEIPAVDLSSVEQIPASCLTRLERSYIRDCTIARLRGDNAYQRLPANIDKSIENQLNFAVRHLRDELNELKGWIYYNDRECHDRLKPKIIEAISTLEETIKGAILEEMDLIYKREIQSLAQNDELD